MVHEQNEHGGREFGISALWQLVDSQDRSYIVTYDPTVASADFLIYMMQYWSIASTDAVGLFRFKLKEIEDLDNIGQVATS
jgi:hypothetical protein